MCNERDAGRFDAMKSCSHNPVNKLTSIQSPPPCHFRLYSCDKPSFDRCPDQSYEIVRSVTFSLIPLPLIFQVLKFGADLKDYSTPGVSRLHIYRLARAHIRMT